MELLPGARVHFYGDSFTFGQGDPEGLGWVRRVAHDLPGIVVANHGVPGAPGTHIVQTWLATTLDPGRTELAVFCFGTNDAVLGIPQGESVGALNRALDRADELDVPVFLVGPPPIGDMPEEDAALRLLSEALGETASARGVPFISTFDELREGSVWHAEAMAADGSHPGAGGYAELADLLERGGLVDWITENTGR